MDTVSRYEKVKQSVSLREFAEANLEHLPNGRLICPCGSGTGPHATPAFSITPDGSRWTCFSCGRGGDVFDLAGYINGTDDRSKQFVIVCEWAGITPLGCGCKDWPRKKAETNKSAAPVDYTEGRENEREYIARCRENMFDGAEGMEYLERRGFTSDEVKRFGIGWDSMKRRVVLPWSTKPGEWYHIDRAIDNDGEHKYDKPKANKVGTQPIHNAEALDGPAVFIVEGMLDAYAVMACGFQAVAFAGRGSGLTTREIIARNYKGEVILMLDNDKTGKDSIESMTKALEKAGVSFSTMPDEWVNGPYKDAAEALEKDRAFLTRELSEAWREADERSREASEERYSEAMRRLRAIDPAEAVMSLYALDDYEEPTPTGLAGLDRALDGGLRRGVYVLGAISSLGKTTLAVQIADHVAEGGRPVLFVTIEQSAREIVAKSITRTLRRGVSGPDGLMSTRTLMSRTRRDGLSDDRREALEGAFLSYADRVAPHMRILEGTTQPSVSDVAEAAAAMAEHEGTPPVVFIDYLQLLAPDSDRLTEKQATDRNMMSLRQMARDLKTTVFVISSLNRSSYSGAISLDSFKESGGIEYGADVLLGLQPFRMGEQLDAVTETKRRAEAVGILKRMKERTERPCEIVVLKQRSGAVPARGIPVTFFPVPNLFADGVESHSKDPDVI